MSGIPSAVIRFVSGCLAYRGVSLYNSVKKLEVFGILPHGRLFLEGLRIAGKAVRELKKIFQDPASSNL